MVGLAVDADATVHGVTSWLPVYGPDGDGPGWTLDVMRRLPDGFRPVDGVPHRERLPGVPASGAPFVSLSGAPLAHSGGGTAERAALERLLDQLGEAMEPLYGFRSLDSFKQKFQPRHEPVYLVFPDEAALPRIGLALTPAYLPDATLRDLARVGIGRSRRDEDHVTLRAASSRTRGRPSSGRPVGRRPARSSRTGRIFLEGNRPSRADVSDRRRPASLSHSAQNARLGENKAMGSLACCR